MSFDSIIKKSFPFISAAASLGGPLGTMAANVVGHALGVDKAPAPNEEGIGSAIAAAMTDPAQRAALLKAEQDFQVQMAELGYKDAEEIESISAADRASARNREIQIRDWTPRALAGAVSFGFFSVLALMFFHSLPDATHDALMLMLGSLGTAWAGIIQYYFGSSSGSAAKSKTLASIASGK